MNDTVIVLLSDASFMHVSAVVGLPVSFMQTPFASMSTPPLFTTVPATLAEVSVTPVTVSVVTDGSTAFTVSVPAT